MSILDNLNEQQKIAASQVDGAVLVLAGAGSGKTRTLTYRIAHMVKEKNIQDRSILAITFTNKAANEMKNRVYDLLGNNDVLISTFHSFGMRMLKRYSDVIGLNKNFSIYDGDDQKKIVTKIIKNRKIDTILPISKILSRISNLKDQGITPNSFTIENTLDRIICEIFTDYQKELNLNNAIDFDDILIYTNKILDNKHILEEVQDQFRYLMVDEYQDTNLPQYNMVRKLGNKYKNVFVVGDDNQSIYGFRGANIGNILNFEKDYQDAFVCKLEKNYRSTSHILEASNAVIQNNKNSINKKLWTDRADSSPIIVYEADDSRKEAKFISNKIKELTSNSKYSLNDVAVLYRNNFQSREIEEEFIKFDISYLVYGGMQFYQRKEIKDMLSYLYFINNPKDKISFQRIVNLPGRGIGQITIEKLLNISEIENLNMLEAIESVQLLDNFASNIKSSLLIFKNLIDSFVAMVDKVTVSDLLKSIFQQTGYNLELKNNLEEDRISNVEELINSSKDFDNLSEYLSKISLASAADVSDKKDHVKLMTIHNSKGLEFSLVFIIGAEEELLPHTNSVLSGEVDEERRLFYVALTRAKDLLYITHAKSRTIFNTPSSLRRRSRFIDEIPTNLCLFEMIAEDNKKSSEALFRAIDDMKKRKAAAKIALEENQIAQVSALKKIIGFSLGERIRHKVFGTGKIISMNLDKVVILFDNHTEKRFLSSDISKFISKI